MKRLVFFSLLLLCAFGCGESAPPSPAQVFNQAQSVTNTPYGQVRPGSAVDNPDGTVTFETTSDVRLTVTVEQTEAGPKYGTPTRDDREDLRQKGQK